MNANTVHPLHSAMSQPWQRIRDVLSGEDAMKAAGERYVSRLDSQSDEEYAAYVGRGYFYNATARTVSGYIGMIFRKPPMILLPDAPWATLFRDDIDLLGTTIGTYARHVTAEVIGVGRAGTYIDWSDGESRAYLAFYPAEDIINWRLTRHNGRMQLSLLVLREHQHIATADDPFAQELTEFLRVIQLTGQGVRVDLYRQTDDGNGHQEWTLDSTATPTRHGQPLLSIPFVWHGPERADSTPEKSPIEDLAITNIDHFRVGVDYKHGLHYTALPTAWVSGFPRETTLQIGSTTAWITENLGATAGYLEFKGEGLSTFEHALDRLERLMTVLGSRLLESQKRVSESAEALAIRQAGESSILATLAQSQSDSLTDVLRWVYWWHSTVDLPGKIDLNTVRLSLNKDFETSLLSAKEIDSLVAAWQAGAISRNTLHHQFERGDLLPPGRTLDEELKMIEAGKEALARLTAAAATKQDGAA